MRSSVSKKLKKHSAVTPYLYLLPAMLVMLAFVFVPLMQVFYYSFHDYNMVTEPVFVGMKNYVNMWGNKHFLNALKNTLIYFIGVVPILVILPLFIAILVNKKIRFIKFFRASLYLPVVTSMVVAAIVWGWIYAEDGILNFVIMKLLPMIKKSIPWLTDGSTSMLAVMIVTIWKGLGYYMVIYLGGLQSISNDVWEAAELDGARGLIKHIKITIPLSAPFMAVVAVMSSISAMKVFEEIYVMTKGGPYGSSTTLVYHIYETAFESLKMGSASAMGFVLFVLLLGFSILSLKVSDKGDTV